jgi:hypothetical protein
MDHSTDATVALAVVVLGDGASALDAVTLALGASSVGAGGLCVSVSTGAGGFACGGGSSAHASMGKIGNAAIVTTRDFAKTVRGT